MGWISTGEGTGLLDDQSFVEPLIEAILSDSELSEEVIEQVADALEDMVDDDPRFQQQLAKMFLSDPARKCEVIHRLANNLT